MYRKAEVLVCTAIVVGISALYTCIFWNAYQNDQAWHSAMVNHHGYAIELYQDSMLSVTTLNVTNGI